MACVAQLVALGAVPAQGKAGGVGEGEMNVNDLPIGCLLLALAACMLIVVLMVGIDATRSMDQLRTAYPDMTFRYHWWWGGQVRINNMWIDVGIWRPVSD